MQNTKRISMSAADSRNMFLLKKYVPNFLPQKHLLVASDQLSNNKHMIFYEEYLKGPFAPLKDKMFQINMTRPYLRFSVFVILNNTILSERQL